MDGECHTTTVTMSAANDLGVDDPKHLINFTDIYKGKLPPPPKTLKKTTTFKDYNDKLTKTMYVTTLIVTF